MADFVDPTGRALRNGLGQLQEGSRTGRPSSGLVSVIVIFFNAARFLEEAITSVLEQHYGQWELLLVDDGSSDGSSEIARSFERRFPQRIRCLHHEGRVNRGMSASRNLGVRHAQGEFIAFLDADDVWPLDKLRQQVDALRSHPEAAMACGAVRWWYGWNGSAERQHKDFTWRPAVAADTVVYPPNLLLAQLVHEGPTMTPSLIRREFIARAGWFEEAFAAMYEDQVFFAKLTLAAPVYVSGTCWYMWRRHDDSSCSISITRQEFDAARQRFLLWLQEYLTHHPVHAYVVAPVVRTELRRLALRQRSAPIRWISKKGDSMMKTGRRVARRILPPGVRGVLRRVFWPRSGRADPDSDRTLPADC